MKHKFGYIIAVAALLAIAPAAHSQSPLSTGAAQTPQTSLAPTTEQRAAVVAAQLIQQIDSTFGNVQKALANGLPATSRQPAVSADEIKAALGQANLAKIQAAAAALTPPAAAAQ